jgi:hypothetical protein
MGSGLIPRRSIADDIFFSGSMENIKLGSHRYLIADDILAKKKNWSRLHWLVVHHHWLNPYYISN